MNVSPIVDLRDYVLIRMTRSTCPSCGQHVFGLAPRDMDDLGSKSFYFLCLCGRNMQAGNPQEIAPREVGA